MNRIIIVYCLLYYISVTLTPTSHHKLQHFYYLSKQLRYEEYLIYLNWKYKKIVLPK